MRQPLRLLACCALVGVSALGIVATVDPAGAAKHRPVTGTCSSLSGTSSQTLSGCTDLSDTGGGGISTTTENNQEGVTTTLTWNTGLTSIESITQAKVLTGKQDKCISPQGYTNDSEVKFLKGEVTGGTASDLIGGRSRGTVCVYSQGSTVLVENYPRTVIHF